MRRSLNIHFVIGRVGKDTNGKLTFLSVAGQCDLLFFISCELFSQVWDVEILHVDISTRHSTMRINSDELMVISKKVHPARPWLRFKWRTDGARQFS